MVNLTIKSASSFYQLIYYLSVLIFVLFLAFVSTKVLGKTYKGSLKYKSQENYMQIIDRLYLDSEKSILLVKISEKYYLLSMDKNGLNLIDVLDQLVFHDDKEDAEKRKDISFADLLKGRWKDKWMDG